MEDFKRAVLDISWEDWEKKVHLTVSKSKEYDQSNITFSFVSHKNTSEWISETSKFSYVFGDFCTKTSRKLVRNEYKNATEKYENLEVSEIHSDVF